MQTTKTKKARDLHNLFAALAAVLFAPFAVLADLTHAAFAPTAAAARAMRQPAPVYSKAIYEDFTDGTSRLLARWNDTRSGISREEFYARASKLRTTAEPSVATRAEADAFFANLIEGRSCWSMSLAEFRAFDARAAAPTRAASDAFRAHFDPKAQPVTSPPDLDARTREGDTFRAYFAEGVRPVDSPTHLDRRPRPLTL